MQIQIISGTVVDGKVCQAGTVVEVTDSLARYLIALKKAREYIEPKPQRRPRARRAPVNRMVDDADVETR